ncbi:Abi-like protein [Rathayibacter sp. PhB93]|nr:Abi-like protein [Rathayibacter sp. PhB93]TDQ07761.1 Abi-like protein [Rathayibacter sp. PhB1]
MISRASLIALLGRTRFDIHLGAASGEYERAVELCQWATRVAGALHSQLLFVEIAVRNAMDRELRTWNADRGSGPDWTSPHATGDPLYSLLRAPLTTARRRSHGETDRRSRSGRPGPPTPEHDDVVSRLTFGAWVGLLHATSDPTRQSLLWSEALHRAFPLAPRDDASRVALGHQLETLRRLRNRVAHHDDLLDVALPHRLNDMLSILGRIDAAYPSFAAASGELRRLHREDPRRGW